jgi:hypothetical protein
VEPGNDPGRDEYGLPPVDIEIPDDARDLDRDVQAYHRELRVQRRHVRIRRLAGPMTRHGMVLPLVAACLALTLLTGSLLTVLSGRQVPLMRNRLLPRPTHGVSASRGRPLPNAEVWRPSYRQNVQLSSLAPAVLALVPAACNGCGEILRKLAGQARREHVPIYFVGRNQTMQDLDTLVREAGPQYSQQVVVDSSDALAIYRPVGLTAILAHSDGSVEQPDVVSGLSSPPGLKKFETRLKFLASASPGAVAASSSPAQQPTP